MLVLVGVEVVDEACLIDVKKRGLQQDTITALCRCISILRLEYSTYGRFHVALLSVLTLWFFEHFSTF